MFPIWVWWNLGCSLSSHRCFQDPVTGQIVNDLLTNRKEKIPLQFSEDCLYLNIYTPADLTKSDRLPVSCWSVLTFWVLASGSPVQLGELKIARGRGTTGMNWFRGPELPSIIGNIFPLIFFLGTPSNGTCLLGTLKSGNVVCDVTRRCMSLQSSTALSRFSNPLWLCFLVY